MAAAGLALRGVVAGVVLAVATGAAAQSGDPDYARSGPYLGLAGTAGFDTFDFGAVDFDPSLGLNARIGYRFLPWLALEGHFEWTAGFQGKLGGVKLADPQIITAGVNLKVPVLHGRFQPYLLAGWGYIHVDSDSPLLGSESGVAARVGGGLDVFATEHVAVMLESTYVLPVTSNVNDFRYVSFGWGLRYRF